MPRISNEMTVASGALSHARAVMTLLFGPPEARAFDVRYWSGEEDPGLVAGGGRYVVVITDPGSLRRMLLPPNELSIVEAVLSGDVEFEGDAEGAMALGDAISSRLASAAALASLTRHLLALPSARASEDVRRHRANHTVAPAGDVHDPRRDEAAIRYHYDVGNDFYQLWLDRRMVYSCAYFARGVDPDGELEDAQLAKLDLICRKLELRPGERFLDVGCGWGALVLHAVRQYGVEAVGITLSQAQATLARARIAEAGLADRCQVQIRDYRALADLEPFDKIASVGMVEHVGERLLPTYFAALHAALRPEGLLLNHGIVNVHRAHPARWRDRIEHWLWKRDAFVDQYVFPDGRLTALAPVIAAAEGAGFETRDVEGLREHYALTLRAWLTRLDRHAGEALRLTDARTVRTWRLYMTASAHGFATGRLNVVQTLLSKCGDDGASGLPLRRARMLLP